MRASPVVLVTGDSGAGKPTVLRASVAENPLSVVAPPVAMCFVRQWRDTNNGACRRGPDQRSAVYAWSAAACRCANLIRI